MNDKIMLVESRDDSCIIKALCEYYDYSEKFEIKKCGSVEKVLSSINAEIVSPERRKTIGVMLDVNSVGVERRWASVTGKIMKYPYMVPKKPHREGTIIMGRERYPKIGIWFMPNNKDNGMLEDFCLNMIEEKTKEYVNNVVMEAKENDMTTYIENHESKAVVHTYLAWQNEPGKPLGISVTNRALNVQRKEVKVFVRWIKELYK